VKVTHLSNTPLSNAPYNLVCCQNHYGVSSRLLLHKNSNVNKIHVGCGDRWQEMKKEEIALELESSDVIHFHNFAKEQYLFATHPDLWELIAKKPKLIQYHSPRYSTENFEATIEDKSLKHAVIAQYHTRIYPECEYIVPNVVPLFLPQYSPLMAKWEESTRPLISYAPSNIHLRGWDDKGYDLTRRAMLEAEKENWAAQEIMIGVPYIECMTRKRWAHVGIDEVMTGSYHLSSLEYLAMGCVTVGRLDDLTKKSLQSVIAEELGPDEGNAALQTLPWIQADPATLKQILRTVITADSRAINWSVLREKAQNSRTWMEKYWHPGNHVRLFSKIYEGL
jgi:hypothetical protein